MYNFYSIVHAFYHLYDSMLQIHLKVRVIFCAFRSLVVLITIDTATCLCRGYCGPFPSSYGDTESEGIFILVLDMLFSNHIYWIFAFIR
jgi:hypothetical protein